MNKPMTCEHCKYCVPCETPKGTYDVCLNAESARAYGAVGNYDSCYAWEADDEV